LVLDVVSRKVLPNSHCFIWIARKQGESTMAGFDVSDVVNITQDKIADGEEILDVVERRRREKAERKEKGHGKIPDYKLNSLFCLKPTNPLRRFCMRIVHHHVFNKFIILTIIANCVFLAINDPICGKLTKEKVMSDPLCS
jgi:hypothetical protein